jgi:NitT/TauT family transport system permease protein
MAKAWLAFFAKLRRRNPAERYQRSLWGGAVFLVKKFMKRFADLISTVLVGIGMLVLWQAAVTLFEIPQYILPGPIEVLAAVGKYWPISIRTNLGYTLSSIAIGYSLTVVISIPAAVFISYSKAFERTIYPFLVLVQLIPKVAIAPLFIVWFGFGMFPKVLMVFLLSFFALLVDSISGFKSLNPRLEYVARTMTDSEWKPFWKMRFPSALPHIFSGLKISIAFATVGAIVGEFVGSDKGLGYLLLKANGEFNTPYLFAVLFVLSVVGILLYKAIELIEHFAIPWHVSKRKSLTGARSTL